MNNLFTEISLSTGFDTILVDQTKKLPYTLNDVKININDILSTDNFNYSLSALYTNFLNVSKKSYFYNPKIPITNPNLDAGNNTVGTLCGAFVPSPGSTDNFKYIVNGIKHSLSAYNVIYDVHDFHINDEYLTIAVGILSASTITTGNNFNTKYYSHLLLANYSLSGLYSTSNLTYSADFPDQGQYFDFSPNQSIVYTNVLGADLQFSKIEKLKFSNDKLYLLDSDNNNFVELDTSDFVINRGITSSYILPTKKLGFLIPKKFENVKIKTFCLNTKYIVFYNYVKNAISVFSKSFKKLYDYFEPSVTASGSRIHETFADIQFTAEGKLYLLTKSGKVYVYSVTDTQLTKEKTFNLSSNTVLNYETFNPSISSFSEIFVGLNFPEADTNSYYVFTERNIYKKFLSTNGNIGQFNSSILNTTYFSTISGTLDSFNTLTTAFGNEYRRNQFLKYRIKNVNSISYNNKDLISVGFIDNSTYREVEDNSTLIKNISGTMSFVDAQTALGINPVSASGISLVVDSPNYINLNNEPLSSIKIYDFDDIKVKDDEFVTDFTINKSIRKLLYNIYNYQTYLVYKPVVDIDVNNNPILNKLEYIIPYSKNQDFSNFDNYIGINEINSTVFLNRCFSKIYNLIESVNSNVEPYTRDIFPRLSDSIQITDNDNNHVILFEDSKQFITGSFRKESYPLNKNLCQPIPSITPTSTPQPTSTGSNVSPTPTSNNTAIATPTPTPTPSVAPDPTANVRKQLKHTVEISMDNNTGMAIPDAPFLTSTYTVSAIYKYDSNSYETLLSEATTTFDQVAYAIDLGTTTNYYNLIGKTYGDYTMVSYTSATESSFKIAGRTTSTSNYDIPSMVKWQAVFDIEGVRSEDSINIVVPEIRTANIFEQIEDVQGTYNQTLTGSTIDSSVRYVITDSESVDNRSNFNFSFSAYRGPILTNTVLLGTNYINNNTAYDLELVMNSTNVNIGPAFNFSSTFPAGTYSDSNTITIPAGARNYPVVLWCNVNATDQVSTFDCSLQIKGLPSSLISFANNIARWNKP